MINIRFDKRLDLIFGLLYAVNRENKCNFNWVKSTYSVFDEAFYQIYKKGIGKEFEDYIINGGLDYYDKSVLIAFSLNDNYEVSMNFEIENIMNHNKNFNPSLLSLFLKDFVNKTNYEEFYSSFKDTQNILIKQFRDSIKEFNFSIIENFFGYAKGYMEIVLLNFSNGSYGISFNDHIAYVSCLAMKNGQFNKYILSTLFHEFSHPYVNPLGEKYFKDKNLEWLLINSKENGLDKWYTNIVTLINEYVVRAIQIILGKEYFEEEYILKQIQQFKEIGYPYIEDLIHIFTLKDNYPFFEDFYNKEVVEFFKDLNKNIEDKNLLKVRK